jgi:thiazole synthase
VSTIRIQVNGEPREGPTGLTIARLLAELGVDATRVAVERNLDVIPRRSYSDTELHDGDQLEIVTFVGGGA